MTGKRTPITIYDDDGPDGDTTRLVISLGGNQDWYVEIHGANWAGEPIKSDAFRASTSGAKSPVITTVVALLAAIGLGEREHALTLAKMIQIELEDEWSRLPGDRRAGD